MEEIFSITPEIDIKIAKKMPAVRYRIQIATGETTDLFKERGDYIVEKEADQTIVTFYTGEKFNADTYRSLGGMIVNWLQKNKIKESSIKLPEKISDTDHKALLEGLLLSAFIFNKYKKKDKAFRGILYLHQEEAAMLESTQIICNAVNMARDWAHEPAAKINPWTLSERAKLLAMQYDLKFRILDDVQLAEMGAGAIVAVGQGSKTPSRMIVLEYPGKGKHKKPVVLVGKAITFDSGGYSIKPSDSMVGMKYDKCGAMAVLGVMRAAAELKLDTPIVGIICAAENMLSEKSYRPDDIIVSLSGLSIEVISTDAEGRLVLADGLTYAQKNYQPRAIIDLATLTGGCVVALGNVRAGVVSNDTELYESLYESGERTWERIWRLPHDDDYAAMIEGRDADIKNSAGRAASPVTGGMFLKEFVSDDVPWAHLDIAGVADLEKGTDYSVPGATGFGIRLLLDWLSNLK